MYLSSQFSRVFFFGSIVSSLVGAAPGNTSSEAPASIFSSSALMVAQVFATNLSLPVSKIMFKFTAGVPMPKLPVGVDPTTCCR